jgi:murein DD-endopeptidase MepM/ murein hydrolase activator NlpD
LFASLALSGVSRTLRRTAVVVSIPAALLMSVFAPATQPVAVQATPVASSVELAATNAAGTLRLGAPLQQAQVGTTTTAVNFRTGPSTGYSIIAVLPAGTQGTVLGTSNGWYNIQTSRGTGWVLGTYFRIGSSIAPAPAPVSGVVGARAAMVPNGQFISGWGAARASGAHQGEDLAAPYGSPIYAPATLTIVSNTWNSLGGWTVIGRDTKGRHWYFAHMSSQSRAWGTVAKGQIIGYVGMTGDAQGTTPHLHYQVTSYGWVWANPVVVLQSYPDVP